MNEPLSEFQEGQWWVTELDKARATGSDDFKRAVAVVHHMLRSAADLLEKQSVEVVSTEQQKHRDEIFVSLSKSQFANDSDKVNVSLGLLRALGAAVFGAAADTRRIG